MRIYNETTTEGPRKRVSFLFYFYLKPTNVAGRTNTVYPQYSGHHLQQYFVRSIKWFTISRENFSLIFRKILSKMVSFVLTVSNRQSIESRLHLKNENESYLADNNHMIGKDLQNHLLKSTNESTMVFN